MPNKQNSEFLLLTHEKMDQTLRCENNFFTTEICQTFKKAADFCQNSDLQLT